MIALQSRGAESFSQSRDHDMTEESSYANPTGGADNESDRCTALVPADFVKGWLVHTQLTAISLSPDTGVSHLHPAWLGCKTEYTFWKHLALIGALNVKCHSGGSWFVKHMSILSKALSHPMSLPLCCEVSELALMAVLPLVVMWEVLTASSMCQGTQKRNGAMEASLGWVLKGAPTTLLITHPRDASPTASTTHGSQGGQREAQSSRAQTSQRFNPALFTARHGAEWHPIDCVLCSAHCTDSFCTAAIRMLAGGGPGTSVCQINKPGNSLCYLQCQWLWGKNIQQLSYLWGSRKEIKEQMQIIKQCIGEWEIRWEKVSTEIIFSDQQKANRVSKNKLWETEGLNEALVLWTGDQRDEMPKCLYFLFHRNLLTLLHFLGHSFCSIRK